MVRLLRRSVLIPAIPTHGAGVEWLLQRCIGLDRGRPARGKQAPDEVVALQGRGRVALAGTLL